MDNFDRVHFRGTFRDYQLRVLNNTEAFLNDGKINIVAAPGSGKTVLGLELIRRLGSPCIILSPTTAVRQQWGQRFRDLFLDDPDDFDKLFSNDLRDIRLLTSTTYQALYTAMEKKQPDAGGDIDSTAVDLISEIRKHNNRTICLDEAHHLKNEWQKALEKFIHALGNTITIISLTATPPYDSTDSEWRRYYNICGEIDEEIFVPELVKQDNLCPHQDYVLLNYPSSEELASLQSHRNRAIEALDEAGRLPIMEEICNAMHAQPEDEVFFSDVAGYKAVLVLLNYYGFSISPRLIKDLTFKKGLPPFSLEYAEIALQFLLTCERASVANREELLGVLKKHSVYEKPNVTLALTDKLKRSLVSSAGKLESVSRIAKSELSSMGERLRMLILTDYIKKESLSGIADRDRFNSVNVVSIFETVRRANKNARIGVLSGSLVIIPNSIDLSKYKHTATVIPGTEYSSIVFTGSLHNSVKIVGELFEAGKIQILIGTKSLLGEGWDSPCINSLILASFVGSFVQSNQMRGRAIRIDPNDPHKTANIWHLATITPDYLFEDQIVKRVIYFALEDYGIMSSHDFDTLIRRFDTFMGPNYDTGEIESGFDRITSVRPPFDPEGVHRINRDMLDRSARRNDVAEKWYNSLSAEQIHVAVETEVSPERRVPVFAFWNYALEALIAFIAILLIRPLALSAARSGLFLGRFAAAIASVLLFYSLAFIIKYALQHLNPARSFRSLGLAVYDTLCQCGLISASSKVSVYERSDLMCFALRLKNASVHDQNIFNTAMMELLSPIDNPRYVLISRNKLGLYRFVLSFACPSIIGKKKEYVRMLADNLKKTTCRFEPAFTYSAKGYRLLLKCKKRSYINFNQKASRKKYRVSTDE